MKAKKEITHKQLCRKALDYLAGHRWNCPVVITELATIRNDEIPDALGFTTAGVSILIECKVSRADFFSDAKKKFRIYEELGLGDYRYFLTPTDLIKPEEVPEKWGLLEYSTYIRHEKTSAEFQANKLAENQLLIAAIRRVKLSTAVFVQPGNDFSKNFDQEVQDAEMQSV